MIFSNQPNIRMELKGSASTDDSSASASNTKIMQIKIWSASAESDSGHTSALGNADGTLSELRRQGGPLIGPPTSWLARLLCGGHFHGSHMLIGFDHPTPIWLS